MSTTTLAAPIGVNHSGVHARPGLARLVAVELRKMVNTLAGLWLQITMVALTAAVVIARRVFGEGADHTFAGVLDVGLQPAAVLLPVTGILLVTSEWSQRTGMITFTLVPVRSRVSAPSSSPASSSPSRRSSCPSPSSPRACSSRRRASTGPGRTPRR